METGTPSIAQDQRSCKRPGESPPERPPAVLGTKPDAERATARQLLRHPSPWPRSSSLARDPFSPSFLLSHHARPRSSLHQPHTFPLKLWVSSLPR